MFQKDTAFKFPTVGKQKPPGVPLAEIVEAPKRHRRRRARSRTLTPKPLRREPIPDDVKMLVWRRDRGPCVKYEALQGVGQDCDPGLEALLRCGVRTQAASASSRSCEVHPFS